MRLLLSFATTLHLSAALCAAQTPTTPRNGVEATIGILHTIALDMDQRRDQLYCYFGTRVLTPAVRIHLDSMTTVAASDACNGVGLGFVVRGADRSLLIQMLRGVIEANPRFDVVSAYYGTEDVDRFGDTVRVARSLSILRGVGSDADPRHVSESGRTGPIG